MAKSENLKDDKYQFVVDEVIRFRELVKDYRNLLTAIGKL